MTGRALMQVLFNSPGLLVYLAIVAFFVFMLRKMKRL